MLTAFIYSSPFRKVISTCLYVSKQLIRNWHRVVSLVEKKRKRFIIWLSYFKHDNAFYNNRKILMKLICVTFQIIISELINHLVKYTNGIVNFTWGRCQKCFDMLTFSISFLTFLCMLSSVAVFVTSKQTTKTATSPNDNDRMWSYSLEPL